MQPSLSSLYLMADSALRNEDRKAAATHFRSILQQYPDDLRALAFLLDYAEHEEDWYAASMHAIHLSRLMPGNALVKAAAARALRLNGRLPEARDFASQALSDDPDCIDGMMEMAQLERLDGQDELAFILDMRALEKARSTAGLRITPRTSKGLEQAAKLINQRLKVELTSALKSVQSRHPKSDLQRIQRAAEIFYGERERDSEMHGWNPGLIYIPGLQPRPWFEREEFDWVPQAEAATPRIREELLGVLQGMSGFSPYINMPHGSRSAEYWTTLNQSNNWSSFHFARYGMDIEENRRRCPATTALLDSLPLMRVPGYSPEPMFSVLRPGTRIPPHYGSANGRLTVHLPLIVPPDCGALKVMDEPRGWEEGRIMVFDDAMLHEAWNHSKETRVVLIFDIWNPQLSEAERDAFRSLLTKAQQFERRLLAP